MAKQATFEMMPMEARIKIVTLIHKGLADMIPNSQMHLKERQDKIYIFLSCFFHNVMKDPNHHMCQKAVAISKLKQVFLNIVSVVTMILASNLCCLEIELC